MIIDKLISIKSEVKNGGLKTFFKKPVYLFYVPLILIIVIKNRWKKDETTIYILEMALGNRNYRNNYIFKKSNDNAEIKKLANERLCEDEVIQNSNYTKEVLMRIKKGDNYVAAYNGLDIVSILFISEKDSFLSPVRYKIFFPENTIGIYDVYTKKEYRGKGIYSDLFNFTINYYYNDGYKNAWLWLMKHNKVSILSHNKVGMRNVIKKITLMQRFGLKWIRIDDLKIDSAELLNN